MSDFKTGWAWPINARKAHFYVDSASLCRRYTLFGGTVELGNDSSPDNCKTCRKAKELLDKQGRLFK
jgi:hypothetical protein